MLPVATPSGSCKSEWQMSDAGFWVKQKANNQYPSITEYRTVYTLLVLSGIEHLKSSIVFFHPTTGH